MWGVVAILIADASSGGRTVTELATVVWQGKELISTTVARSHELIRKFIFACVDEILCRKAAATFFRHRWTFRQFRGHQAARASRFRAAVSTCHPSSDQCRSAPYARLAFRLRQ